MTTRSREEPASIGCREVAQVLEYHGYERMAAFVRRMGEADRTASLVEREWQQRYMEVVKRLHKYEPPPPTQDVWQSDRPGPMSDG